MDVNYNRTKKVKTLEYIIPFLLFFWMGDLITTYFGVNYGPLNEVNIIINTLSVLDNRFIIWFIYKTSLSMFILLVWYKTLKNIRTLQIISYIGIFLTFNNSIHLIKTNFYISKLNTTSYYIGSNFLIMIITYFIAHMIILQYFDS